MVLALAVAASLSLGAADYLAGATLRRDGRDSAALTYTTAMLAVGLVVVVAAMPAVPFAAFSRADLLWSIGAGAAFGVAFPLLMYGMARGPIAVVAPVLGLTSLVVPAIVGPLLGDRLSTPEVIGLIITLPAAVLIGFDPHDSEDAMPLALAVSVAMAAGALLGASAIFFGRTSTDSGIVPGIVAQLTGFALLAGIAGAAGRFVRPTRTALRTVAAAGGLSGLAVVLTVVAYQRGPVAVVAAVIGLAPGLTVVLAWRLIGERINRLQIVGLLLGASAIFAFALG